MSTHSTGKGLANPLSGASVVVCPAFYGEHLEPAAGREVTGVVGQEAVEPGRAVVLGLVDDASVGIGGGGLMHEAAHLPESHGLHGTVGGGGDLEDVAVILLEALVATHGGLLAGEPGLARGGAAGAVGVRPAQAHEVPL